MSARTTSIRPVETTTRRISDVCCAVMGYLSVPRGGGPDRRGRRGGSTAARPPRAAPPPPRGGGPDGRGRRAECTAFRPPWLCRLTGWNHGRQQLDLYTAWPPAPLMLFLVMMLEPVWIFGVTVPPSSAATAMSTPYWPIVPGCWATSAWMVPSVRALT